MTGISKTYVRVLVLVILLLECAQGLVASVEKTIVIIFHKPPNVVTTHQSQDERPTVYEELKRRVEAQSSTIEATGIRSKLHAIGRLDVDTTGLILLTNDGGLVHHVTNPTSGKSDKIPKTYEATIMGHHTDQTLESLLLEGIDLGPKYGGLTQPVDHLDILSHPTPKSTIVSLTISEGKNRQIRRMFHAIGSGVMKLKRTHIGNKKLSLDMVPEEGQWKVLSNDEIRDFLEWEPRPIPPVSGDSISSNNQEQKKRRRQRRRQK